MKDRLKQVRKSLNLTQAAFAETLNLKQNTITAYENGFRELTDRTISDICDKFSVNEKWLRSGEGEMFIEKSKDEQIAEFLADVLAGNNDFKKRFINMLSQLNEDDWETVQKMAELILSQR